MSTNQQKENSKSNNEEEVDLGSLFVIIGKGFSKFFNFIGDIFKGIFHSIILVLIFFRKNAIKVGISIIIGALTGAFFEFKKQESYGSDLIVQPNFNSTKQLYTSINYYSNLVSQKKIEKLKSTFNIDEETAKSLKSFSIKPIFNDKDIINTYNSFAISVDTTAIKSYSFLDFKKSFTDFDYKFHEIKVVSSKNDIFKNLEEVIISSIETNKYFSRIKSLTNENLNRTDLLLRKNLIQADTLSKVYMQVMLDESKRQTNGTNIDLGGSKKTTKELEIFDTKQKINSALKAVLMEKSREYEVVNIISNFQPIGYKEGGILKNAIFQYAFIGGILMVLCILIMQLNRYLNNYIK